MSEELTREGRNIDVITSEIIFYRNVGGQAAIEIGKRMIEAKAKLKHGEWIPWLNEKVEFSEATAQRFMKLAREYSNPAPVRDLGVAKALQLLALPEPEREAFLAEKHDVNGEEKTVAEMSRKELEKAIRERDEARKALRSAEDEKKESSKRLETMKGELLEAEKKLRELESRPVDVAVQDASAEQIEQAKAEARAEAQKDIEKLKAEEKAKLDKLAEQLEKAKKKLKEQKDKDETSRTQGAAETERLKEEIDRLKKQIAMAGEGMTVFKLRFGAWQEAYHDMLQAMNRLEKEQQGRCEAAIRAVLKGWREENDGDANS